MASLKFILIAGVIACARAGGPAAYSISALSGDHASIGAVHENTVKGLYGQNVLSQYTKTVSSPHSSVHVSSSKQSNDIHGYGAHYGHYAAPAHSYGAVVAAPAYAHHGYAAPAYSHSSLIKTAPTYAHHGYAAPALTSVSYAKHASPLAYAHGSPAYGHAGLALATPAYASHGYASPLGYNKVAVAAGPAIVHSSFAAHGASYAHAW